MRVTRGSCATLAAAALLASACCCSYLKWRREKKELRGDLERGPGNLLLEKEYAPQNCYAAATGMSGFGDTHVGILSDPGALEALAKVLDATTGKP